MEAESSPNPNRSRLIFVGGALLLLVVVIAVTLLTGGGESEPGGPATAFDAPDECLDAWNQDEQTVALAAHNVAGHGYSQAQVGYIDAEGDLSDDPDSGDCAVVFGASQLDIDLLQVGQVNRGGRWTPLAQDLDESTLETLQLDALDLANAGIGPDGRLEPRL